ncbi:MAG: hypothetical protein FJ333_06225 [Sphingomonadales bacterium]|nr:hypothetical protein [Sphingomonadales bacterium]
MAVQEKKLQRKLRKEQKIREAEEARHREEEEMRLKREASKLGRYAGTVDRLTVPGPDGPGFES